MNYKGQWTLGWTVGKVYSKDELEKIGKEKLNEDPNRREADIRSIKDWMSKQPHLKDHGRKDDNFILMYLRGCKYSLEKTKQKLDMWHTVRTHCPDMFDNWSFKDPKLKEMISAGSSIPLQGFDKHGRRVLILRGAKVDPDKFTMIDQFRANLMVNELLMKECDDEQGHINGVVIIQDIADVTVRHMKTFSPTTGKKAMTIFQEAYPANPKAMYFLGMPSFMTSIFNVMMSFSKEKFKQRIQLVGKDDFAKLHEELGIEILPKEYGGTNGSVQDHLDVLIAKMEKDNSWLTKQYKHKSNEKKRPGTEKLYSDIFGMEGSFRQLSVD